MAREAKYSPARLEKACKAYLRSISRTEVLQEEYLTGYDEDGKPLFGLRDAVNDDGEPVRVQRFVEPPGIAALCLRLGITKRTWNNYARREEYATTVERVRTVIENYLYSELLTRKKGVQGVMFALQHNHGYSAKMELEFGPETRRQLEAANLPLEEREALLREVAESFSKDAERRYQTD